MKNILVGFFLVVSLVAWSQDHGHLNIGSTGVVQNDPLIFSNADIFNTATNYVKTLTLATNGNYAGYYQGNITLTGLAATEAHAGPEDFAAALGAQIHAQLVSVDGPPGGIFSFWETAATTPTISLVTGTSGTNTWQISENNGSPGSDPYGHFHGRRFTATAPGIYTVGFRAFDFSTNGATGGPIHTASSVTKIYFQAGVNLKSVEPDTDRTRITFSAPVGKTWVLEVANGPTTNATWTTISAPIAGDDYFHETIDETPVVGNRFYRARGF